MERFNLETATVRSENLQVLCALLEVRPVATIFREGGCLPTKRDQIYKVGMTGHEGSEGIRVIGSPGACSPEKIEIGGPQTAER